MLSKKQKFSTLDFTAIKKFKGTLIPEGEKPRKVFTDIGVFCVYKDFGKFSVVLNKKNFKTAVVRNKYKRLFYNTLRVVLESKKNEKEKNKESEKKMDGLIFYPKKTFTKEEIQKTLNML